MKILSEYPPIYDDVIATFPDVAKMPNAIFTFGSFIYNPSGVHLPRYIIEHEQVHETQQRRIGPIVWWKKYLRDAEFRLSQELPAYQTEYKAFCKEFADRNARASFLQFQSAMLSSSMYGNLLSIDEARAKIITI